MNTFRISALLNRQFWLFLLTAFLLAATGCVSYGRVDGPYAGKVVDAQTGQPLEGVVVSGVWNKAHPGAGGASHTYYDSREVLTDKNGEFKIQGLGMLLLSNIEEMDITIFKAGYNQIPPTPWSGLTDYENEISWQGKKPTIRLKKLSREERRKRIIDFPSTPINKQRLIRIESNKENLEIGSSPRTILPVE